MELKTQDMSFSAYLLVTRKLPFLKIEVPVGTRQAFMVFDDQVGVGTTLETDFLNGAVAPAADFHQKLRYLRKKIDNALSEAAARDKAAAKESAVANG
jgi:hypothetical protein